MCVVLFLTSEIATQWLVPVLIKCKYRAPKYDSTTIIHPSFIEALVPHERLHILKADLCEVGSFDYAIQGCHDVFHVATHMEFGSKDPEVSLHIFGQHAYVRSVESAYLVFF
jgi:hypothetical protein